MSRLFEALTKIQAKQRSPIAPLPQTQGLSGEPRSGAPSGGATGVEVIGPTPSGNVELVSAFHETSLEIDQARCVAAKPSPTSRLVALTDSKTIGAEKFRALATRLDHLRKKSALKSLQVTSSVINEGKTVVAANLAVTLAKYGSRTLLVEGDLHRPTLAALFGLSELDGIGQWWSRPENQIMSFVRRCDDMALWLLAAGEPHDHPSEILHSPRLRASLVNLVDHFDWIVVDSPPLLPVVDANLWSGLLDGTVLVVRERVTPIAALKKGLQTLDLPKLVGVVLNDSSEVGKALYEGGYYGRHTVEAKMDRCQ